MRVTRRTETSASHLLHLDSFQQMLAEKLDKVHESMATKDCIKQLSEKIMKQTQRIDSLKVKVEFLENHIRKLEESVDDQEQYNRRLYLRIAGIPITGEGKNESGEQFLAKVQQVFQELNVNIPDTAIDRAHRIGRGHQMIVRFTSWRYRTLVYRARKTKDSPYKIRLDLTKKRLNAIVATNDILKAKEIGFSFADVNCRLCAKIGNKFYYFSTLESFKALLDRLDIDVGGSKDLHDVEPASGSEQ